MRLPPPDMPEPKMVTVKYAVNPEKGSVQAKVVDQSTKQVVREIPSDQQIQAKAKFDHIVDELA